MWEIHRAWSIPLQSWCIVHGIGSTGQETTEVCNRVTLSRDGDLSAWGPAVHAQKVTPLPDAAWAPHNIHYLKLQRKKSCVTSARVFSDSGLRLLCLPKLILPWFYISINLFGGKSLKVFINLSRIFCETWGRFGGKAIGEWIGSVCLAAVNNLYFTWKENWSGASWRDQSMLPLPSAETETKHEAWTER